MAIEEDLESCGSRAIQSTSQAVQPRHHWQKLEVYNEVLRRIQESNFDEASLPGFDDQLWLHFNRLPARYVHHHIFMLIVNSMVSNFPFSCSGLVFFLFVCRETFVKCRAGVGILISEL